MCHCTICIQWYTPFAIKKFTLKDIIFIKKTKMPLFPSGIGFHKCITFFPRHLKSTALLCCPRTSVKRCNLILKLKLSSLHAWVVKLFSAMSSASQQLFSLVRCAQGFTAGYCFCSPFFATFEVP